MPFSPVTRPIRHTAGALVLLLTAGLSLGAGAAPAMASAHTTQVTFQAHWSRSGPNVQSILVENADGTDGHCWLLYSTPPPFGNREWMTKTVRLPFPGRFQIFSYNNPFCDLAHYYAGSQGTIDTGRWQKWSVSATRPPKMYL
ncbi:hypothetical protein [Clavibacter michiganensis]|uniref:hypothetical protein n=2 Tax=Clavibacter michiganensis TaxID=28447 RepID=UPI000B561B81|nr:hypothetical protein [Clavibacter michiganensis]MDO4033592.1 hypothetical protein [Clavibacter michiganensis]OUD90919.1 hypothetical protein CMMCAS04_11535 [Clavibacter michiganensis subsp. michiganensis]